jgi:predicted O-methyltransferase YrrM
MAAIPLPGFLKEAIKRWRFLRAFRAFEAELSGGAISEACLKHLIRCWGNPDWSVQTEYALACLDAVRTKGQSVLECGSGLSTLMLAAASRTSSVTALEHHPGWAARVRASARELGLGNVEVVDAPLRDYGEFSWYGVGAPLLRRRYTMVVCDGPPGDTKGGRYGMLPVMKDSLEPGCMVLLDDASRPGEQETMSRWKQLFGLEGGLEGAEKPYAILTTPRR